MTLGITAYIVIVIVYAAVVLTIYENAVKDHCGLNAYDVFKLLIVTTIFMLIFILMSIDIS